MSTLKLNNSGLRKLIRLLVNFLISMLVYRAIIEFGERYVAVYYAGVTAYTVTIAVLFCLYYAWNGYTLSNDPIDFSNLPDDMSAPMKKEYADKITVRRKKAKSLLYIIAPMALTVMIDYLLLMLSNFFAK